MAETHSVLFAVFTNLAQASADALKPHLPEHLAFLKGLREEGVLAMAGPFFTPDGKNSGDGFYVLRVDSLEEARRVAAEDPMHRLGVRTAVVRPWVKDND